MAQLCNLAAGLGAFIWEVSQITLPTDNKQQYGHVLPAEQMHLHPDPPVFTVLHKFLFMGHAA